MQKKKKPGRARFEKAGVTRLKSKPYKQPKRVQNLFPETLYVEREEDTEGVAEDGEPTIVCYVADTTQPTSGSGRIVGVYQLVHVAEVKVTVKLEPILNRVP